MMNYETKRPLSNGMIVFNRITSKYTFRNVEEKYIKKIYRNGFNSPLRIQWRITQKCNLRCKHCYLDEKNNTSKELSKKQIIEIARKIINSGIFEILITGGEPTTKEGLADVIKILGKKCNIILFTNALNKEKIKELLPLLKNYRKTLSINVSLDGPKEIHESIRGKNTYKETIKNIKLLANENLEVNTNTVLTTLFIPHLDRFIEELTHLGVNSIKFSKFYSLGEGKNSKELMPSKELFKETLKKLLNIKKKIKAPKIIFDNNFCFLINGEKNKIDTRKCSGGISKLIIEPNGNTYPCQLLPLKKFFMGNILKEDIKHIWKSKNKNKFIEDFLPDECKSCKHNKYCNSGCKASSYSLHKTFKHKDPYCFYEKS